MQSSKTTNPNEPHKEILTIDDEVQRLVQSLPQTYVYDGTQIVNYQGFWYRIQPINLLKNVLSFQRHFQARNTDLIIASFQKTGTTWLKSLLFSVANRDIYTLDESPLRYNLPHELVHNFEFEVYNDDLSNNPQHVLNIDELRSPRLLQTHIPYISLPESIKDSECKVIYIARNPMNTLVSLWHFFGSRMKKLKGEVFEPPSIEEYFEEFYEGKLVFGPYFEHVLDYWKHSLERPDKVLFLKYEDLKDDPVFCVKKLAEFIGMPFSDQEENDGVVKQIIELCSISNMKEMKGNKSGLLNNITERKTFFRKGEVGDWKQHLTPLMVERMDALLKLKFQGTGLSFKLQL